MLLSFSHVRLLVYSKAETTDVRWVRPLPHVKRSRVARVETTDEKPMIPSLNAKPSQAARVETTDEKPMILSLNAKPLQAARVETTDEKLTIASLNAKPLQAARVGTTDEKLTIASLNAKPSQVARVETTDVGRSRSRQILIFMFERPHHFATQPLSLTSTSTNRIWSPGTQHPAWGPSWKPIRVSSVMQVYELDLSISCWAWSLSNPTSWEYHL
jgi:hypothetical protein